MDQCWEKLIFASLIWDEIWLVSPEASHQLSHNNVIPQILKGTTEQKDIFVFAILIFCQKTQFKTSFRHPPFKSKSNNGNIQYFNHVSISVCSDKNFILSRGPEAIRLNVSLNHFPFHKTFTHAPHLKLNIFYCCDLSYFIVPFACIDTWLLGVQWIMGLEIRRGYK